MKNLLPFLSFLLIALTSYSQTFINNNITYKVSTSNPFFADVISYNIAGGTDVTIPASVTDNGNTYFVTEIHAHAFFNRGITSVVLPSTLKIVFEGAFKNNNLTNLTLPNNVIALANEAFAGNSLTNITFSTSLTSIGSRAFKDNLLTDLTLPNGISVLHNQAFENNNIINLQLPTQLTNIGVSTFKNNNLESVEIPSLVINIQANAFQNNPLNTVTSLNTTPPSVSFQSNTDSFGDRSNINLIVPPGTLDNYLSSFWTGFNTVTEDATLSNEEVLLKKTQLTITNEYIKIHTSNNSSQLIKHTLYNLSGQKVNEGKEKEISTTRLTKGLYILRIDFKEGSLTKKVMLH